MRSVLLAVYLILCTSFVISAPTEDKVAYLPEMGNFAFNMFSGYLEINNTKKALHYVFAESQNNPQTDPLLVWFNGGPGCSSLLGFLQEHGPYVMEDEDNFFHYNNYSWNKEANIVYIESPAGVGYSVCNDTKECNFTDENSSEDNLVALYNFMVKFPEFANHDLYLSGESYAGIYVPYLAWQVYLWNINPDNEFKFNLKGIMVGNGVTNWEWDGDAAYVKLAWYLNLYSPDFKAKLMKNNCQFLFIDAGIDPSP